MSNLNRQAAELLWGDPVQNKNGNLKYWDKKNYTMRDGNAFDPEHRIEHAWMLVEWLLENTVTEIRLANKQSRWYCELWITETDGMAHRITSWYMGEADTAPEAITRAFVEAMGNKEMGE